MERLFDVWSGKSGQKLEAEFTSNSADNWALHFCAHFVPAKAKIWSEKTG